MFGHEGLGLLPDPHPILETRSDPHAGARIAAIAEALVATRPEVLVAIGPLTNLGALARDGHALPPLVVMGGRFADEPPPGMLSEIPEWNWWCDPVAVQAVLATRFAAPPRIVPLDVTWPTRLEPIDLDRLADGDALARTIAELGERWLVAQRDRLGAREPCIRLHDPLALACLARTDLVAFSEVRIRVGDEGETRSDRTGPLVRVAGPVDNTVLRSCLLDVWLGGEVR
jgi:inosine-uridine nucleoside N-ribohydrolase